MTKHESFDYKPYETIVGPNTPTTQLEETTGISARTFKRCRKTGRITAEIADRAAIAVGRHPGDIWPEWWHAA